jgi:hypothetical protein
LISKRHRLYRTAFGDLSPAVAKTTADWGELELVVRNIRRLIDVDAKVAWNAARVSTARREALEAIVRSGDRDAPARMRQFGAPFDLAPIASLELRPEPWVLAIPFTRVALIVLAHLLETTERTLVIGETLPTSRLVRGLFAGAIKSGRIEIGRSELLLRRNKTRASDERLTFVTFADHQTTDAASRIVDFAGAKHHLPLIEPLLAARGATPIVTFAELDGALSLAAYDQAGAMTEAAAQQTLRWIAQSIEGVLRLIPGDVLAWQAIVDRKSELVTLRKVLEARMMQAWVRLWSDADRAIAPELRGWSLDQLRTIETSIKDGESLA